MYAAIFARTYPLQAVDALFSEIAADGYRGTQFNLSCLGLEPLPKEVFPKLLDDLKQKAGRHGVALSALSGTYNMAHPDQAVRQANRSRFATVMEAAMAIGAPIVTVCTGSRNPADMWAAHPENASAEAWRDMRTELEAVLDLAERHDMRIGIEPEPGNVVSDAERARQILDEIGSKRLGIVLDAANLVGHQLGDQIAVMDHAAALLGNEIILVHAKDIDAGGKVVAAGAGAVDLQHFIGLVHRAGYDGAVIAHGFQHGDTKPSAEFLQKLLQGLS